MKKIVNPNLRFLLKWWKSKRGIVLEGSSRSGKTFSVIFFLIYYCAKNKGKTINIVRKTYKSFKTTLFEDFNTIFPMFNLASPTANVQDCYSFKLFGNKINIIGADDPSKIMGAGSDVVWINEAIHVPMNIFDQLEMRCRGFFILDYNPEKTKHWIYDNVKKRDDVVSLKTTFLDNPHCPPEQKLKILGFEPTHPDDRHLLKAERRPHPTNIEHGTASDYNWDVFGLGIKAEIEGKVYDYKEYSELPEGARFIGWGGDHGWSHPAVVVKMWQHMNNIYVQQVVHSSQRKYPEIYKDMLNAGYNKNEDCCFDSEDPRGNQELKGLGLRLWRAYKKAGWKMFTIRSLHEYQLFVHERSFEVKEDLDEYRFKMDKMTGKPLEDTEDIGKDSADAIGYIFVWGVLKKRVSSME